MKATPEQQLGFLTRDVLPVLQAVAAGYTYDPGSSDLDDEQPIDVRMTLGDYRRSRRLKHELESAATAPKGWLSSAALTAAQGTTLYSIDRELWDLYARRQDLVDLVLVDQSHADDRDAAVRQVDADITTLLQQQLATKADGIAYVVKELSAMAHAHGAHYGRTQKGD